MWMEMVDVDVCWEDIRQDVATGMRDQNTETQQKMMM